MEPKQTYIVRYRGTVDIEPFGITDKKIAQQEKHKTTCAKGRAKRKGKRKK